MTKHHNARSKDVLVKMHQMAIQAMDKAYAPYSQFYVGACILTDQDDFFVGCNIENSSYPNGLCAEASAIANMVVAGKRNIKDILVVGHVETGCAPCGACRQKILEFSSPDTVIHIANVHEVHHSMTMSELLPESFRSEHLLKKVSK